MVTSCSWVTGFRGPKRPPPRPFTTPVPSAHTTASAYQAAGSVSEKLSSPVTPGSPAMRQSTVASWARVKPSSGENRSPPVPCIRSRARTKATEGPYQASGATSAKPAVPAPSPPGCSAAQAGTARRTSRASSRHILRFTAHPSKNYPPGGSPAAPVR